VAETGQPYAYTGDDPTNTVDSDGLYCYRLAPGEDGPPECLPGPPYGPNEVTTPAEAYTPLPSTPPFQCAISQSYNSATLASYSGSIACDIEPLDNGTQRSGSTAAEARSEAEASGCQIPPDYIAEPAENGRGWVFRAPGSSGNANIVRVGEADSQNPTGYVRYHDSYGQPLNAQGSPLASRADTHLPLRDDPDDPDWDFDGAWFFEVLYTCGVAST
jgi:hypothetical protein